MRRRQIMDAAKMVFASKGFGGATMENIAEKAEFSPATLYLYFKNKDELFASLNLRMLQDLIAKMDEVRHQENVSPEKKIMALEKALYDVYLSDPLNVVNVLRFQSRERLKNLSPELTTQIRSCTEQYIGAIAVLFEEGVREGVFLDCHPVAFAEIIWSVFTGLVLHEDTKKGLNEGKEQLEPTLIMALEILGRGIMKN